MYNRVVDTRIRNAVSHATHTPFGEEHDETVKFPFSALSLCLRFAFIKLVRFIQCAMTDNKWNHFARIPILCGITARFWCMLNTLTDFRQLDSRRRRCYRHSQNEILICADLLALLGSYFFCVCAAVRRDIFHYSRLCCVRPFFRIVFACGAIMAKRFTSGKLHNDVSTFSTAFGIR